MKLKDSFIFHRHADGVVMMPTSKAKFSGVVQGNQTFAVILELLRSETTEEALVAALQARYDAPEEKLRADAARALSELRAIDALDE